MINKDDKIDSLQVLQILVKNCPAEEFSKQFVLDYISKIAGTRQPEKLLRGQDYIDFMTAKEMPVYKKGI